jgi:hypothetical protein
MYPAKNTLWPPHSEPFSTNLDHIQDGAARDIADNLEIRARAHPETQNFGRDPNTSRRGPLGDHGIHRESAETNKKKSNT